MCAVEKESYAIIKDGSKQYRVAIGDTITLEKHDCEVGSKITFDRVLMVVNGEKISLGHPFLDGAKVEAQVISQGKGAKVDVVKFKRRKGYLKQGGHRQWFTKVEIKNIAS